MLHVFVETNWLVGIAAPSHRRIISAQQLLELAERRRIHLHLPSICLSEALNTIRRKFKPRTEANAIRRFLAASTSDSINDSDARTTRRVIDIYEAKINEDMKRLPTVLNDLRNNPAIHVFAMNDAMLERAIDLTLEAPDLRPIDRAILASVLIRADELRDEGAEHIAFCELDGDLRPWDRAGNKKSPLHELYQDVGVYVLDDFEIPSGFLQ